ncbi:MAG TPA: hypothetical protein VE553_08130, partial [Candidatus Binatia bacterium]|nr:hypothetical protein [Candidatus Binatia bacterium]
GQDARPVLQALDDDRDPQLPPELVAAFIFESALLSSGRDEHEWQQLWPQIEQNIALYLRELERQSRATGLARRALRLLEHSVASVLRKLPAVVGRTRAVNLEVTSLFPDVIRAAGIEQLHGRLRMEGDQLGSLQLRMPPGGITGQAIADAIARDYAWPILGRFFAHTLYPRLDVRRSEDGASLWRGDTCLLDDLPPQGDISWESVHDKVGWLLFLQEIWARPNWPDRHFYDATLSEEPGPRREHAESHLTVALEEPLPDVVTSAEELSVSLQIGRRTLGPVPVTANGSLVPAQRMRAALTAFAGFDLCRIVVRETLVGKPLSAGETLLQRLSTASDRAELVR